MPEPTMVQALMGETHHLWSPHAPEDVARRLDDHSWVNGTVRDDLTFDLSFNPGNKNSWRPKLSGRLRRAAGGTFIEVQYSLGAFILLFTLFHGMFLFGLSWMLGAFAYNSGLKKARMLMAEASGATHFHEEAEAIASGHEVSDPTTPGADANAPLSFEARSNMNEAVFQLRGTGGTRTRLTIGTARLELERGESTLSVDWNDLVSVDVYEGERGNELRLETRNGDRFAPMSAHSETDQLWLATYLDVRNTRWSEAEADRQRSELDRQRLAAVQSGQKNS